MDAATSARIGIIPLEMSARESLGGVCAMQTELISLLAGRRGHFSMESRYHSEQWFNLDALFASPSRLRPFVAELARRLAAHRIDAVCGPMTGGAKLAQTIAAEIGAEY